MKLQDIVISYRSDSVALCVTAGGELGIWQDQILVAKQIKEADAQWYRSTDISEVHETFSISESVSSSSGSGPGGSASTWTKSKSKRGAVALLIEGDDHPLLLPIQDQTRREELLKLLKDAMTGSFPNEPKEFTE
jgi:hypothetical protein